MSLPSKRVRQNLDCSAILTNLENILCIPIESTCDTFKWLQHSELLFINKGDPLYRKACSAFNRKTQFLSFDQFFHMHSNSSPLYYQRTSDPFYYNIEESLTHIEMLLLHQYKSFEQIALFVKRLYEITEKILPKLNTLHIIGEPNSGKSWFAEMVVSFYMNIGHVKNFTRHTSFPLNDCPNRRILLWNEPSIAPSHFETVKMLTGGDPCPAAVKYEGDSTIIRTPLIITSNHSVFPQQTVWKSRIYTEYWTRCHYLKNLDLYPHPLAFYYLIKKYIN